MSEVAPDGRAVHNHGDGSSAKAGRRGIGLVAGAARHALWYLRYQVDGETRVDPGDRPKR